MGNKGYDKNIYENNIIDSFKLIMSFLVVTIHVSSINKSLNSILIQTICRIAVPYFFCIAGYFLYPKIKQKEDVINYITKLIKIYLIWSIIYLPINIYTWNTNENSCLKDILLYLRSFIFVGSYTQLWYLPALICGTYLIYLLLKKIDLKRCMIISFILYLIGTLGDSYFGIINVSSSLGNLRNIYMKLFVTTRNGLFFAMFFILLGMMIKKRKDLMENKIIKNRIGLLISIVLMFLEVYLLNKNDWAKDHNMYLALIPTTYFLINILIGIDFKFKSKISFRDMSLNIYLVHMWVLFILRKLMEILNIQNSLLLYVFTIILSIFSCSILSELKKKDLKRYITFKKISI